MGYKYSKMNFTEYWQEARMYNRCMDVLNEIYTRWYGSAYGVTHYDVRNLYNLVVEGKTSLSRYKHELNDKIYFDQTGKHLYKDMEGKDVEKYILKYEADK